jgi:hypothetical protein
MEKIILENCQIGNKEKHVKLFKMKTEYKNFEQKK